LVIKLIDISKVIKLVDFSKIIKLFYALKYDEPKSTHKPLIIKQ